MGLPEHKRTRECSSPAAGGQLDHAEIKSNRGKYMPVLGKGVIQISFPTLDQVEGNSQSDSQLPLRETLLDPCFPKFFRSRSPVAFG